MKIEQRYWQDIKGWTLISDNKLSQKASLVLVFGERSYLEIEKRFEEISEFYPKAHIVLCSTAGEILGDKLHQNSIVLTAISFETSQVRVAQMDIASNSSHFELGKSLCQALISDDLRHIFLLADSLNINSSELLGGMNSLLPKNVNITGGLAADMTLFQKTIIGVNQIPSTKIVAAIGFYGQDLDITYSCAGGWEPFGVERKITKSQGNQLFELEGKTALSLYKSHLGKEINGILPATSLFTLSIRKDEQDSEPLVRAVLAIDEVKQSLSFAGDIPQGYLARLMRTNLHKLIEGAETAARNALQNEEVNEKESLAILLSCVGRYHLMQKHTEMELKKIRGILDKHTTMVGFYAYGEFAPRQKNNECILQNQSMTITILSEKNT